MFTKTAAHLVAEAKKQIENVSPEEVAREPRRGHPLLVDVREAGERQAHGTIPGAIHAPRGMLEFAADPTSAYYQPAFDPARHAILFCASGARSALAAATLRKLGYTHVSSLSSGLNAWVEAGFSIEPGVKQPPA
jgi:rhodanese-related sulfurtransferase